MSVERTPPSGGQHELRHGGQRAVVAGVGASIRTYDVDDRPVLDGYDLDRMCDGARGQTLAPWANRVKDGVWHWQGEKQQLALTEPEQHNAIHGLVRWLGWHPTHSAADQVTLEVTSYPQPGYRWPLRCAVTYRLDDDGLTVTTSITNLGSSPAPVSSGSHPYLTVGTPLIDDATLHLPADTYLPTGDQQIPLGRAPVAGTDYDFREPHRIGSTEIDYAYTDLHRDGDGRCRLRMSAPGGASVVFWVDEAYDYLEIFTGDALPDPSRRRQGLGVEPMSAPPNAMASGESLAVLEPLATWTGEWGITPWEKVTP